MYSVTSGYLVAQKMNRNGELGRKGVGQASRDVNNDPVWRALWQLKVPPKLCHFVWKGCRNIIAVITNLQRRGIRLENTCPFCVREEETQVHLFFRCPFASVFWFGSLLQLDMTMVEGEDFMECWKWLSRKYGEEKKAMDLMRWVVCSLWRI